MENRTDQLAHAIDDIYCDLLLVLSQPDKDIEISLLGDTYYFSQPVTAEEREELVLLRHAFIKKILIHSISKYIETDEIESFGIVKDLFLGPDPKEFQLEMVEEINCDVNDSDAVESIRAIPLDTDNVLLQSERPDLNFDDELVQSEFIDKWSKRLEQDDAQKDKDIFGGV